MLCLELAGKLVKKEHHRLIPAIDLEISKIIFCFYLGILFLLIKAGIGIGKSLLLHERPQTDRRSHKCSSFHNRDEVE